MRQNTHVKIPKDLVLFGLLLMLSIFIFIQALKMPPSPHEPLGPGSLPLVLAIGLGSISLIKMVKMLFDLHVKKFHVSDVVPLDVSTEQVQKIIEKPAQSTETMVQRPLLALGAIVGLCLMVIILQFRWVGFRVIGFMYVLGLSFFLHRRERGVSRASFWLIAVIVAVVMSFGVHWLFTSIFNVRLR